MKFEKSQAAVDRLTPEQRRITQDSGTESVRRQMI